MTPLQKMPCRARAVDAPETERRKRPWEEESILGAVDAASHRAAKHISSSAHAITATYSSRTNTDKYVYDPKLQEIAWFVRSRHDLLELRLVMVNRQKIKIDLKEETARAKEEARLLRAGGAQMPIVMPQHEEVPGSPPASPAVKAEQKYKVLEATLKTFDVGTIAITSTVRVGPRLNCWLDWRSVHNQSRCAQGDVFNSLSVRDFMLMIEPSDSPDSTQLHLGHPFASVWQLTLTLPDATKLSDEFASALPHVFPGLYWFNLDTPRLERVPPIAFPGKNKYFVDVDAEGRAPKVPVCDFGFNARSYRKVSVTLMAVRMPLTLNTGTLWLLHVWRMQLQRCHGSRRWP